MSDRPKKWIIKDTDGRIHGPFGTEKVLYKIGRGELCGDESIATFPGGSWFAISQEPQFYDRLMEALEGEDSSLVYDENYDSLTPLGGKSGRKSHSSPASGSESQSISSAESATEKKTQDPVRGSVKREIETSDPTEDDKNHKLENDNLNPQERSKNKKRERRSRKRQEDGSGVIELADLGKLIKKEKFRQLRLPMMIGIIVIALGVITQLEREKKGERVHLLHLHQGTKPLSKVQLSERTRRAQEMYSAGNYFSLLNAQNELIQVIEGDHQNASMIALLCLTYFELWPYAYQDSSDLKAISIANQRVSGIDPAGQNTATCQVVDLLVRSRYPEAKSLTEAILETYSASAQPPTPFYYLKAYLLSGGRELPTAIGYLNSAQQLSPRWLAPYILEAEFQTKSGNSSEAAKIYRKVLSQNPHHKIAKIELGLLEIKDLNHSEKGFELIKEALATNDLVPSATFSRAYFGLAEVALARKDNTLALEYAQKSYSYNSSNAMAKNVIVVLGGKERLASTSVSSQQMVFQGDQFVREGDYNAAQAHYKTAFELDKTNALAAYKAGQSLWQLSFSREAIDWLNKAIKADQKLIDAYVLLADYFTQRYDFLSAARVLAQAQRVAPRSHEVFRGYALVELRRGNAKGAIGYGNKALSLYETDVETNILLAQAYFADNDPNQAYKYASKSIELDINSRQGQIEYSRALAGIKGTEMGLDYLLKLVNSYPLVTEYRMALGEMLLSDERFPEAIEIFRQVTEIEEKPKKAFLLLGKAQRLHGQTQAALESLLKSAVLDPADTEPLFEAGLLYLEIGKPTEAKTQFQRVLRINASHPSAHYHLGRAAIQLSDPKEALAQAEEEKKINPNLADAYILAADAHYRMNQHSLCAREYTTAIKLRPQGAETYVKLARCYRLMGSFDMAESMLKAASKYDSALPDIYRELGEVYLGKGNLVLAAETFNQYFQLSPGAQDRVLIEKRIEDAARGANR